MLGSTGPLTPPSFSRARRLFATVIAECALHRLVTCECMPRMQAPNAGPECRPRMQAPNATECDAHAARPKPADAMSDRCRSKAASEQACGAVAARENVWGRHCRPQLLQHHCGVDGQVSIPEQNETVNELAGPSQHLLPAASKTSSGKSSPRTSSSKSAVVDSLM